MEEEALIEAPVIFDELFAIVCIAFDVLLDV